MSPTPGDDLRVVIDADFKRESQTRYAELRTQGPLHQVRLSSGLDAWLVVGHAAAREALTHPDLRKDPEPASGALAAAGFVLHRAGAGLGGNMLESDPPEHTRLRRIVSGAFTPKRTAGLFPSVERIADELLDALPPLGQADLVPSYTAPLPARVIARLLGVPEEEHENFRVWSRAALQVSLPEHKDALANVQALLRGLIEAKRARPTDDLLSDLVAARDKDDSQLSEDELMGTALLLMIAGHETTVNLLGNSLLALLRHPDQLQLLRERPDLVPGAVEEFLRYDPSVELTTYRYAAQDLVLAGSTLPRGSLVVVSLPSAARDLPLPDGRPTDELDVTRSAARHLSFGHGIHHCLGAPLARLEAVIALQTLLRRLPRLDLLALSSDLPWISTGMMRGVLTLPVRYEQSA
ncbi:cytochrome P450 family protein [Streptomyces sp. CA-111067]|uniref:cytochrome P450 family protein n=1 Tax=Streptomyces sp. CA-111067 TaxID=3240046 RepID=UPI003D970D1F